MVIARKTNTPNAWLAWVPLANDPTGASAFKFFADPAGTQRLLLSDYTHLYFSSNGGSSWTQVYTTTNNSARHTMPPAATTAAVLAGPVPGRVAAVRAGRSR